MLEASVSAARTELATLVEQIKALVALSFVTDYFLAVSHNPQSPF